MRSIRHHLATLVATIALTVAMVQVSEAQQTGQTEPAGATPEDAGAPVVDAGANSGAGGRTTGAPAPRTSVVPSQAPWRLVGQPRDYQNGAQLYATRSASEACPAEPVRVGESGALILGGNCGGTDVNPIFQQVAGRSERTPLTVRNFSPTSSSDGCEVGRQWCRALQAGHTDAYFLCVDARDIDHLDHFFLVPDGLERTPNIFLPNRRLIVATRTQGSTRLSVSVPDEQIGIEMPRIDVPSAIRPGGDPTNASTPGSASDDDRCYSNRVFSAPALRSGTGRITIKQGDNTLLAVPFVVDVVHAGAVRLGVASVFGPAVSHQYNVLTAPGSGQREIGLSFSGGAEFELVVGASAFVWDLLSARNGRTYAASRPWWSYALPSPYVGLGVVGTLGDKFTVFQSMHLGGEWEFARSFTIGVTAVLRRTTRLNDGLSVGSPVSDDDIGSSTHQELNWGLGLVVNFSPEFLQVMTPSTRSSSSGGN